MGKFNTREKIYFIKDNQIHNMHDLDFQEDITYYVGSNVLHIQSEYMEYEQTYKLYSLHELS